MVRGCLTQLLADETGEGDQETILRRAIALIDRFISAETAEIGTEGDAAEPATDAAYLSLHLTKALTPQSLHDAAIASGAKCAGETPESEPAPLLAIAGKSAETPPAVDLEALKARLSEEAVKQARALIGR
jgi:hypothetical protein